jgi:hypothetical protein
MEDQHRISGDPPESENNERGFWKRAWSVCKDLGYRLMRFLFIEWTYKLQAQEAYRKLKSEFAVLHSTLTETGRTLTPEEDDAIKEIQKLINEAENATHYIRLWSYIYMIELQLIHLYDENRLTAQLIIIRNNLYILDPDDKKQWENTLEQFKPDAKTKIGNLPYFRSTLYYVLEEIQRARRLNYLTTDLKRALIKKFWWFTMGIGAVALLCSYLLVRDSLVFYAAIFGILGGFISRLLSVNQLEFKPPAFSLVAMYNYIQPLFGGIGALILYLILISPVGPQVISTDTFYMNKEETRQYIGSKLFAAMEVDSIAADTILTGTARRDTMHTDSLHTQQQTKPHWPKWTLVSDTSQITTILPHYPKPSLFLLLAFLAGFSERWLLGTLETIVGKKLQQPDAENKNTTTPTTKSPK